MVTFPQLKVLNRPAQNKVAKAAGLKGYTKLNEEQLIDKLLAAQHEGAELKLPEDDFPGVVRVLRSGTFHVKGRLVRVLRSDEYRGERAKNLWLNAREWVEAAE